MLKNPRNSPFPLGHVDPSSTWMIEPIPLTTPNDSSISLCTSAQLRNKGPTGYNGTPQIHPQNCPFPSTITNSISTPIPRPTPLTIPTASRSTELFCHSTLCRQTDKWSRWKLGNTSAYTILIESNVLIIIRLPIVSRTEAALQIAVFTGKKSLSYSHYTATVVWKITAFSRHVGTLSRTEWSLLESIVGANFFWLHALAHSS